MHVLLHTYYYWMKYWAAAFFWEQVYTRGTTCNKDAQSSGKNPFSTDFYHLFKKIIYGWIYGFFLTRLGYYPFPPPPTPLHFQDSRFFALAVWTLLRLLNPPHPTPLHFRDSRCSARAEINFFRLLPPWSDRLPKSQDFSEFRLGNPVVTCFKLEPVVYVKADLSISSCLILVLSLSCP